MFKVVVYLLLVIISTASAVREPLTPAGPEGEEVAAALALEYVALYEPELLLGDARELYGWRCGGEPVGFVFIARAEGEEPPSWKEHSRLKHDFMATAPTVGVELTPEQEAMRAELRNYRMFTVLFTPSGPKVAYFGHMYEGVFLTEGVVDVGYGPYEGQVGFGVVQDESTTKRVGDEWLPLLAYRYFPAFSMEGELFIGPFPPELLEGNIVPYFDNERLNLKNPAAFNARDR